MDKINYQIPIDELCYIPPIQVFIDTAVKQREDTFAHIMVSEVTKLGINVSKEELEKALAYDRDQYHKGYEAGRTKYMIYGNSGGINEVVEKIKLPTDTFGSIKAVYEELVKRYPGSFSVDDLCLRYYGYDDRINKDVYIIGTGRQGDVDCYEKFGYPQFVCYMIQL